MVARGHHSPSATTQHPHAPRQTTPRYAYPKWSVASKCFRSATGRSCRGAHSRHISDRSRSARSPPLLNPRVLMRTAPGLLLRAPGNSKRFANALSPSVSGHKSALHRLPLHGSGPGKVATGGSGQAPDSDGRAFLRAAHETLLGHSAVITAAALRNRCVCTPLGWRAKKEVTRQKCKERRDLRRHVIGAFHCSTQEGRRGMLVHHPYGPVHYGLAGTRRQDIPPGP